jgi:hypothetical protein
LLIDHPDFASPNPLVDTGAVTLPEVAFCDKFPLTNVGAKLPASPGTGPNVFTVPQRKITKRRGTKYSMCLRQVDKGFDGAQAACVGTAKNAAPAPPLHRCML